MTDRIHSLTVVLDKDYRDDGLQAVIDAILMIKTVLSVDTHISDSNSHMAEVRIKAEYVGKIVELFYPKKEPK